MEAVGALPRRKAAFAVAVYAPLALTPTPPDAVLVLEGAGRCHQLRRGGRGAPRDAAERQSGAREVPPGEPGPPL